jgi:5,10-methylenetetrahydrofolate reductase
MADNSFPLPSGVHFYIVNQAALSTEIWRRLKL